MAQFTCTPNTSLVFNVTRRPPELIPPARPTPYEFKELSDIDNLDNFRHHTPVIQFYRFDPTHHSLSESDPTSVIREATAKALVWYYPFAGRLREKTGGGNKLVVECNGEGVMFIEAKADVCLKDFGETLLPPFPCLDQLLYDVPGFSGVLDSPLILIQGLVQFMSTVAEFARGARSPSIQPVWDRHLLTIRNLPLASSEYLKLEKIASPQVNSIPQEDFVHKSFFFGPTEIAVLRRFIPPQLTKTSTFEILTACLWRCRTIALQPNPEEIVPIKCVVNVRNRCNPPLSSGYYGNAFTYAIALPRATEIISNPIFYALQLIKNAKANIVQDYMTSLANLIAQKGTLHLTTSRTLVVSDTTRLGFDQVDFGWGPPAYGGPAKSGVGVVPGAVTFYVPFINGKGEKGIAIPMCLGKNQMETFVKELDKLLGDAPLNSSTCSTDTPLVFKVTRRAPELIPPARPTPYEFKELSDIDNLQGFRHHTPVIHFYRNNNNNNNDEKHSPSERDPAMVVREATAKALMWYYPLAGRLREKTAGAKLVVECNGEGVMFIEAEADVCLKDFGEPLLPPFPCLDELLFDVPGSSNVTKLKCGGFILALRLNHTMSDAQGLVQFMGAVAELARGAQSPSIQPVWDRHLLTTRNLPRVTSGHHNYDNIANTKGNILKDDMVHKSFFFGPTEIAALRRFIPHHLTKSSIFEILTACIWRCRTIALQPNPNELVPIKCVINARNRCQPPLPHGYYGNAYTYAISLPTAANLSSNPISYALKLVKTAKTNIVKNYMTSLSNLVAQNGMLHLTTGRALIVSDVTRVGFDELDFGWGPPVYGGPAKGGVGLTPGITAVYVAGRNGKGEKGIVVPICLRSNEMEIFVTELNKLLCDVPENPIPSY
ncbi:Benzyl alcohol O-benzoyltransferase, partial [Bienertia sinuspersici]